MSRSQAILILTVLFLSACVSSRTRTLSHEEALQYGLTGVIYDAPLCPNTLENGKLRVSDPCELVTCEPKSGQIICRATRARRDYK